MRYVLINDIPKIVRSLINGDNIITNPTDEQIDEAEAGYPLDNTEPEAPVIDEATQKVVYGYALIDGVICKTATATDKTNAELIADINTAIDELNTEFAAYKDTPIIIDDKGYLPRWVYEYYNSLLLLGETAFPMAIAAVDGTATEMTFAQFQTLYQTLVTAVATHTAAVNEQIAELNAQKAELGGE